MALAPEEKDKRPDRLRRMEASLSPGGRLATMKKAGDLEIPDDPPGATVPEPPVEETVKGPDTPAKEQAPAEWWRKAKSEPGAPEVITAGDKETQENAVDILVGAVDLLHDHAADATHYPGWSLTPKEIELWRKVLRFMLKRLKMKDWDLIVAIVGLVIAEFSKVFGYLSFRKANGGGVDKRSLVKNSKVPAGAMGGDLGGNDQAYLPGGDLAAT
jgi:hypothetical protein